MTLEIYFNDLTPEAQARYLDFFRLDNAEGGNLDCDIIPIFMLDSADLDWDDDLSRVNAPSPT